jgi:hypothetical protein
MEVAMAMKMESIPTSPNSSGERSRARIKITVNVTPCRPRASTALQRNAVAEE